MSTNNEEMFFAKGISSMWRLVFVENNANDYLHRDRMCLCEILQLSLLKTQHTAHTRHNTHTTHTHAHTHTQAVTSSVNASNVESKSPCEAYAQYRKHAKYDKDFKDSETHIFGTVVWETFGAINSEGEAYLRQLMRFASKHLDLEHSSYCGRMWSRLSCVLQRQIAREIELRTKEQKYQCKRDEGEEGGVEDAAEEVANR